MYADPRHIRDHVIKVRLNEDEARLLVALSEYNKSQPASFARDLLLDAIRHRITHNEQQEQLFKV